MSQKKEPDGRELWIGGYPLLAEREMTAEERKAVSARILRLNAGRRRWMVVIWAVTPAFLISTLAYADSASMLLSILGMTAVAAAFIIFAVGPLRLRDLKKEVADELEHLRCGKVASMDLGQLEDDLYEQATERLGIETRGELREAPKIEVYLTTGIIATTDQQESDGSRIGLARVAPRPRATNSAPARMAMDAGRIVRIRAMSKAETSELSDFVVSHRRAYPLWPALGLGIWSFVVVITILFGNQSRPLPIPGFLLFGITLVSWVVWIRAFLFRKRLLADLAGAQIAAHTFDQGEVPVSFNELELLPLSRAIWTVDGESAEWRRLPG